MSKRTEEGKLAESNEQINKKTFDTSLKRVEAGQKTEKLPQRQLFIT
jgi:hypothetical protein